MSLSSSNPLEINDLTVRYAGQDVLALDTVSWAPPAGQLSAIVGPNGAGKSTLLKAVVTLIKKQNGSVRFWGKGFNHQRYRVSYMAQLHDLDWGFPISVLDVVKMGLQIEKKRNSLSRNDINLRVVEALGRVGMQEFAARQIGALSGGQRRRVFLARALAQNADLYLMDEPFAGVDAKAQEIILDTLKTLKKEGKTVVVVHHNLNTVKDIFDHVLLLNKYVVGYGMPHDVMTKALLSRVYSGNIIL